jgi:hypothetical protein
VKTENIPVTGRVVESLADYKFRVVIDGAGHQVIARLCGKMISTTSSSPWVMRLSAKFLPTISKEVGLFRGSDELF